MTTAPAVVVVSGYFCPLHEGHIELFRCAREFAGPKGKVVVIVNSDEQAVRKRGLCAVLMCTRLAVLRAVRYVDEVVSSIDTDRTVCATLDMLCQREEECGSRPTHFANAGDRSSDEVPESAVCRRHGIVMQDLPGAKVNSSSDMIRHIIDNQHALKW